MIVLLEDDKEKVLPNTNEWIAFKKPHWKNNVKNMFFIQINIE